MATAMFLRTYTAGSACTRRCWPAATPGAMPQLQPLALHRADAVFVALVLAPLMPLRVLAGWRA